MDEPLESGTLANGQHAVCWACQLVVQVPLVDGQPSSIFKCGWCGAITTTDQHREVSSWRGRKWRCISFAVSSAGWAIFVFVLFLISSIVIIGCTCLLPHICAKNIARWAVHLILTACLTFNVTFNYLGSVFCSPGTVQECIPLPNGTGTVIPQMAFHDFTYCTKCQFAKPPDAHHCRLCRKCIVDMDHHCPFINNCVGRANTRNFLLFLFWTMVSVLYAGGASIYVLVSNKATIYKAYSSVLGSVHSYLEFSLSAFLVITQLPWWLIGAMYLCACSIALGASIGVLLWSQLSYICKGTTLISSLKGQLPSHGASTRSNLARVLGGSGVKAWLAPRWGPAAGAVVSKKSL